MVWLLPTALGGSGMLVKEKDDYDTVLRENSRPAEDRSAHLHKDFACPGEDRSAYVWVLIEVKMNSAMWMW